MKMRMRFDHAAQAWLPASHAAASIARTAAHACSVGEARYLAIFRGEVAGQLDQLRDFLRLEAAIWDAALTAASGMFLQPFTARFMRLMQTCDKELRA